MKVLHVFTLLTTAQSFFDGQFKYLSEKGAELHVVSNSREDKEFSAKNRLAYSQLPISRKIDLLGDLGSIQKLLHFIRKEQFDIVVGHTPKGAMVAMIAAKLAGVRKRVYYRHGLIYTTASGLKRIILKTVERLTSACATNIVNVSPSLSDLAVNDYLNSNTKQTVIGAGTCGGIDTKGLFNPDLISVTERDALRIRLSISKEDFIIGFCGRLCKEKGIRELIDGFNMLKLTYPNSKLLLVGPYDTRDILPDKYKKEITDNPDIISVGKIDKINLPLYYSLMDVFVFPSYREGFGMCVLEASAMKVPILVSRSHGCIDTIQEYKTGEYIDISPEGIIKGILSLLQHNKKEVYGESGREWVKEKFDHTVLWPKIKDYYMSLDSNHHELTKSPQ